MASRPPKAPVLPLTRYQQAWVADRARFKHGRWARQSGKTFGTTLEIADDLHARRSKWVILSRGARQSQENMEQLAVHCRAYGAAAEILETAYAAGEAVYKQLEIRLPNGSRALGLPANPDTARGHSAHVYLDEFAFHPDSRKIWAALFPTITRGYRLIVTSTPQGKSNKFYELEQNPEFSKHKVDIYDAVAGGLALRDETGRPITPEQLREALGDEEAWQQEYLVQYLDEATAFLPYELIATCEDDRVGMEPAPDWTPTGPLFLGMDIARKRDLSVLWVVELLGDVLWTRAVQVLERTPFSVQREVLYAWLPRVQRAALDATGLGLQLAEEAQERFGAMVEPVTFSLATKEALSVTLRRQFEDRLLRIPADRLIREDLHRIKRVAGATGAFRFDAARNEEGHADRYWGLALAVGACRARAAEPRIRALAPGVAAVAAVGGRA